MKKGYTYYIYAVFALILALSALNPASSVTFHGMNGKKPLQFKMLALIDCGRVFAVVIDRGGEGAFYGGQVSREDRLTILRFRDKLLKKTMRDKKHRILHFHVRQKDDPSCPAKGHI